MKDYEYACGCRWNARDGWTRTAGCGTHEGRILTPDEARRVAAGMSAAERLQVENERYLRALAPLDPRD